MIKIFATGGTFDKDYDEMDETSARASQGVPIGPLQGEGSLFGQGGIGF